MTVHFQDKANADLTDLLRAKDTNVPGLVLEVGGITRGESWHSH